MEGGKHALAGRIPYRIRIGVTGHRNLESCVALSQVIRRIRKLVPDSKATPVRLAVVSALAEGADRLVVDEVFDQADASSEEARLEVVLPFERHRYAELQGFSAPAEEEFDAWLRRATSVVELSAETEEGGYEAAGRQVVGRSDVLVALWDGKPARGRGGTADILVYASEVGKPCIWIPTGDEAGPCPDNLDEEHWAEFDAEVRRRASTSEDGHAWRRSRGPSGLKLIEATFRELDAFNRPPLRSESAVLARAESELGTVDDSSAWVAGPFARASILADRFQRRFTRLTWLMSALATAAAACLGVSLSLEDPSPAWTWAEVGCLLALTAAYGASHRLGLHRRWLSYRVLAERLRSAYYIAPTGIDFRRTAALDAVFVESRSADWLLRAFEEVWDSRPGATAPPSTPADDEVGALRARLADEWIGGQIAYHARARRQHERRGLLLTALVLVCFFGALAFAVLHATTTALEHWSIRFSVTLPVAAAALGVILTVRQHRALAERYRRMEADLVAVRRSLHDADAETLSKVTSEAARVVAEENGDWFGAMWFLDVEHPP